MIDPNTPIEYKFLDMDNEILYNDANQYYEALRYREGPVVLRAIPNYKHNQCLYVAGVKRNDFGEPFSETEAINLCRKLSGME